MWSILKIHGNNVETLSISQFPNQEAVNINAYRLIALLDCVPQLKSLIFNLPKVIFTKWHNHGLTLEKLESLTLSVNQNLSIEFAEIFTSNTIKKLEITGTWNHLKHFVIRQANIIDLELNEIENPHVFESLQLDSITACVSINRDNLAKMITSHPELKKFKVWEDYQHFFMSAALVRSFCALENLECVHLSLTDEILDNLHSMTNLKNLKEVIFDINSEDLDEGNLIVLATVQLDKTEKIYIMDLNYQHMTQALFFETAGMNWRNLKDLEIDMPSIKNNGVDILNLFLDNFQHLENLDIYYPEAEDGLNPNILNYFYSSQQYPSLKFLKVHNAQLNHFQDLVGSLPNLEILQIDPISYSPYGFFQLSRLEKLEKLYITFKINSKFARFNQQEGDALKSLCRRLNEFQIIFVSKNLFIESLLSLLANCDHFIEADEPVENEMELTLTLTNVKY